MASCSSLGAALLLLIGVVVFALHEWRAEQAWQREKATWED